MLGRSDHRLLSHWNGQPDNPFVTALNDTPKDVASTSLSEARWAEFDVLQGEVTEAVGTLEDRSSGVLAIMGSGQLIRTLMAADLRAPLLLRRERTS